MRKIIFFLSCLFIFWINISNAAVVTQMISRETSCNWALVNATFYISWNSRNEYLIDEFWYPTDRFIANSTSEIKFWESEPNLISNCRTSSDWYRQSEVAPWNNTRVVAFWANCTFNKPTNINNKTLQFVYKIEHWAVTRNWTSNVVKNYSTYNHTTRVWNLYTKAYNRYKIENYIFHANECYNVTLAWCWDWVLDSANWEVCDPAILPWQPWYNPNCNSSCQITPTPSIQIDKRDANPADLDWIIWTNDSQTVNVGSWATFRIRVTNNWTESLRNLVLTDAIAPNCAWNVTLPATRPATWSWFIQWWSWNHTNNTLEPWEYFEYTCSRANTTTWYTNSATVTWIWVTSGTSVNATDTTVVITPTVVTTTCNNLTATPATWNAPLTSVFNCSATNASSYRIEIFSWSTIATWAIAINTINTNTGSYTFTNTWSYVARCTVNGNITSASCQTPLSVTTAWPSCWTAWWYTFSHSDTDWVWRTFCSVGTPTPNPPAFPSQWWSTSWTCNHNWSTVTCNAYRWSPWGWGWWGGWGWSSPVCIRISIPALEATWSWKTMSSTWSINYTCYWNIHVWKIWIDCDLDWDWTTKTINEEKVALSSWTWKSANFTCTYTNPNKTYRPRCYVWSASTTITTWSRSDLACWTTLSVWPKICWDWVVQRPNDAWVNEECEKVLNPNTWVLEFPFWCEACKSSNFTIPWVTPPIITIPDWWSVEIYPLDRNVIIWQWSDPIIVLNQWEPYIYNNSSTDLYLDYPLCAYKTDNDLIWASPYCSWTIWWLYPWVSRKLNYTSPHFTWATVPSSLNYLDSELKITLGNIYWKYIHWFTYIGDDEDNWPFFTKTIDVRVSKPAIATVWGWTSLLQNTTKSADISKVAWDWYSDPDKNKNFVWAWVSTWSISSYWKTVTWSTSVTAISSWQTNQVTTNTTKLTWVTVSWNKNISETIPNYNWISNVYIVKWGNLTISSDISWSWPRTYIVECNTWTLCSLNINQDIKYSDNIAFVVKWWNIVIAPHVKNMNWTYISIPVSWIGWKIISGSSNDRLIINWSLYGDITSLVSNRTYIQNSANNIINVWTVVSYGSNLFRKPAPLVWDFIWEYMASKKVAK